MIALAGVGLLRASPAAAQTCDPAVCLAPGCHCASDTPPGNLAPGTLPQLVVLTVEGAVTPELKVALDEVLLGLRNPNACAVPLTYYVTTGQSDRGTVCRAYAAGHEIASHTNSESTGVRTTREEWSTEIGAARQFLGDARVPATAIRGFRAPSFAYNGALYEVLSFFGYGYDSSISETSTRSASRGIGGYIWPYSLDYGIAQRCTAFSGDGRCPDVRAAGLWEVPAWNLVDPATGTSYVVDPAPLLPTDEAEWVRSVLTANFEAHLRGNHAPLALHLRPGWLIGYPARRAGLRTFLRAALDTPDTWLVTGSTLVRYMKEPRIATAMQGWPGVACGAITETCSGVGPTVDAGQVDSGPADTGAAAPDAAPAPDVVAAADGGDAAAPVDAGAADSGRADASPRFEVAQVPRRCGCNEVHPAGGAGAPVAALALFAATLLVRLRRRRR